MTHRVFLALGFGSHGRGSGLIRIGLFLGLAALPLASQNLVTPTPGAHRVALVQAGERPRLILDAQDYPGVRRAAENLASDLERVTGQHAEISMQTPPSARMAVIIGTLGHSSLIDQLVKARKLDVSKVQGRWEAHVLQVVRKPLPGVENALVIAGSDKRGTIYGIYDVSEQAGVSPWYWWADVPVQHRDALYVEQGKRIDAGPAVKYRGIFLNDEEPALGGWARKTFGGFNSRFYGKVFELILRLKGNYLWPAMWGSAFNEDDPANAALADELGVVMGTSHHEPMLRAQQEWGRHGSGPWDFTRNAEVLKTFWADGIRRNKNFESLVTVGMRGDGDMPMEEGANVSLLEGIVASQRGILEKEMGKPAAQIPQLWALYKEVQGYFEKGMKVPDDVTLLWCDDNWGNIRRLPTAEERHRSGGAGIYYHFDYVGGPRNYKWLYTMPLAKVWEQMSQAHAFGADRIWIVNVGDLKPMELPIEFFLRLAWNPDAMDAASVPAFVRKWAAREFGEADSAEIAEIVQLYQRFNGRRKPEMLSPDTFSLIHEREAERVVEDWKALEQRAEAVYRRLPKSALDAFDQLVLHPVKACRVVNEMLVTAGFNRLYAEQGRASANRLAARVKELFEEDAQLTKHYHAINGGKWNHFMDQKHLGYTIWQEPPAEVMPAVSEIRMAETPAMAVAIEGTRQA
ncbi:MAG TPA: glycosyl hydrolase 115 family protein [Holophaga sp.]|nr:glycosyl hydrolase 115 family protein [Holophaga sp.]